MKRKHLIRYISIVLTFAMILSFGTTISAYADEGGGETQPLVIQPYQAYAYPTGSKKGLAVGNTTQAVEYNSKSCMYNLEYTQIVTTNKTDKYLYTFDGKDYYFDDTRVSNMRDRIDWYKSEKGGEIVAVKMYSYTMIPGLTYTGSAANVAVYGLDCERFEDNIKKVFEVLGTYLGKGVDYWIIGNEIDAAITYNYLGGMGRYTLQQYAQYHGKMMLDLYHVMSCYNGNAGYLISFDQGWNFSSADHYNSRDILNYLRDYFASTEDFCWGLSAQCYNVRHTDAISHYATPIWWNDKKEFPDMVKDSYDTPLLTLDNMNVMIKYMSESRMLYKGKIRPILITEIGFSEHRDGKEDEDAQVSGFTRFHNMVQNTPGIVTYFYNDQPDNKAAGIWFNMTGHKIEKVFKELEKDDVSQTKYIDYGDVNFDGKYDLVDIVLIRRHIQNLEKLSGDRFEAADINGDKKVDLVDLVYIRGFLLGTRKFIPQR